jgi:hypothetical protein
VRLVDFLISLLEAHAETLKRLAAFFGEERLLEMLESADDDFSQDPQSALPRIAARVIKFETPSGYSGSPYQELEGSVREFGLPAVLEFHLWAYPYYRAFIESNVDLNSRLSEDSSTHLINEAMSQAKQWIKKLPIPPAVSLQSEAAAELPWVRFRTQVLKRMGKRPMGAVT